MEQATVARPYAEALFQVAKNGNLNEWVPVMNELSGIVEVPEVLEMVANPRLSRLQVTHMLLSLIKSAPDNKEVENLIRVLVENERVALLPEISRQFIELKNASEGSADAEIVSAYPLSDAQLNELLAKLEQRFGLKLIPQVKVDDSLIGGVYVVVGDEVLDLTVRAKLQNMQEALVS